MWVLQWCILWSIFYNIYYFFLLIVIVRFIFLSFPLIGSVLAHAWCLPLYSIALCLSRDQHIKYLNDTTNVENNAIILLKAFPLLLITTNKGKQGSCHFYCFFLSTKESKKKLSFVIDRYSNNGKEKKCSSLINMVQRNVKHPVLEKWIIV